MVQKWITYSVHLGLHPPLSKKVVAIATPFYFLKFLFSHSIFYITFKYLVNYQIMILAIAKNQLCSLTKGKFGDIKCLKNQRFLRT